MARDSLPRRIYNPFPGQPKGLTFLQSHLHFDASKVTSRTFPAGKHFLVSWDSVHGYLSVSHRNQPDRTLWATTGGSGFLSAAFGESSIHDSRGSYSLDDKVDILFTHQTVENISLVSFSGTSRNIEFRPNSDQYSLHRSTPTQKCNSFSESICFGSVAANLRDTFTSRGEKDADGTPLDQDDEDAVVVVTGCLYTDSRLAEAELRRHNNGNYHEEGSPIHEADDKDEGPQASWFGFSVDNVEVRIGVRYKLVFAERRDHQLGFQVELGSPVRKKGMARSKLKSRSFVELPYELWPWSTKPRSRPRSEFQAFSQRRRWQRLNSGRNRRQDWTYGVPVWVNPLKRVGNLNGFGVIKRDSDGDEVMNVPRLNRILLTYASHAGERFFGFGEQFSCFDMKGKRLPIMVQEQGLGRGDQPITAAANLVAYRAGGDWHTSYAPSPHYLTSDMNSIYLEGYEHSIFDLTQSDHVQVQVHAGSMKGRILYGQTPHELIEQYTAAVGRMPELPAWVTKGAIVGMQGGHKAVRHVWQKLEEYDVPLSAFWLQDWVGQRKTSIGWQLWWNWEVDRDHYQGWEELVNDLKSSGVRTMTYLNPFIVSTDDKLNRQKDLFTIAREEGYLVPDTFGSPYMIPNTSFEAAMLDLTNPETRKWLKDLMYDMVKTGVRGWMADFGESLPFDSCLYSGEDPGTAHNRYPEMWAELNREFVEEWEQEQYAKKRERLTRSPGDLNKGNEAHKSNDEDDDERLVFFMRAGYRGSPRWATLFWEGDQMVSWQKNDGIKSAVTGLLSSGVSGYAFNHSDIGGYCTVDLPFIRYSRTEELLMRWMELNAFSVIFRTHEGNNPGANIQFYSNDRTFQHFARCAKVFKAWEFYRRELVKEAAATGMPVIRHLFLHYPDDKHVHSIIYQQFLVGSEILVVPVLDKGHTQVKAYFPGGDTWEHLWTGLLYKAQTKEGLKACVQAPLGFPAVFVKKGSWVGKQFMHNLMKEDILTKAQ